ncbi:MAG: transglutaminase domain-containing protein, partial [Terracidiphilus sp.]
DLDKAKKLYDAVQALDNTDYSRHKTHSEMKELGIKQAKHAEDTWAHKSGSSEDIAMLYLALLRAAGLNAVAVKVVDRDRGIFDPDYLTLDQLDTTLVALTAGGKQMVLDPGEKMCTFGALNWRHSGVEGLSQSDKSVQFSTTPELAYNDNIVSRTADLTLDAHGGVTGSIQIIMTGQESLRWRQASLRNDESELKKQYDEQLEKLVPEGVEAHIDHFLGLDKPGENLMAMVNVTGTLGAATAKRLLLPGLFFETRTGAPFVKEETRMEPVDMQYAQRVNDDVIYHLPAGMTVEGAPQDASLPWQGHAVFILKCKPASDQIEIQSTLARAFSRAKPEEYQDLRGFFQKVAAAEQAQVVLKAAPETSTTPATPAASTPAGKG